MGKRLRIAAAAIALIVALPTLSSTAQTELPPTYSVRNLQLGLQQLGYLSETVDGRAARTTREAIRKYQSDNGHAVTGVPTAALYHQLRAIKAPVISSRDRATILVKDTSDRLVAIANSADSTQEKRRLIREVLDPAVDMDDLARICLGRFWHSATPAQRQQYTGLFRELLVTGAGGADHHGAWPDEGGR
jgi:hypothetical protein